MDSIASSIYRFFRSEANSGCHEMPTSNHRDTEQKLDVILTLSTCAQGNNTKIARKTKSQLCAERL